LNISQTQDTFQHDKKSITLMELISKLFLDSKVMFIYLWIILIVNFQKIK